MARSLSEHEQQIVKLIRPLRTAKWQADYMWNRLEESLSKTGQDFGGFELTPDFQRGHIWSRRQSEHFIENCLRGVLSPNALLIQFNCPNWNDDLTNTDLPPGLQCIDGLQRYTAVTSFVKGEIKAFGFTAEDLLGTQFSPSRFTLKVAIHDFQTRHDLLQHYLDLNTGGTVHSDSEIARVKSLLAQAA